MASPPLSYCAALVRDRDYDRYLCTLFAPAFVREAWFALFAFNYEIAAIPETVSEEMLGFVRFAWWRESLDDIYAGGPLRRHPVVEALGQAVRAYRLPRAPFDILLTARQERFSGEELTSQEEWEIYFSDTSSTLFELCAQVANLAVSGALNSLGIAWAAIGTARAGIQPETMLTLGEKHLSFAQKGPVPKAFLAFEDMQKFYFNRLRRNKNFGQQARGPLLSHLLWRHIHRLLIFR